MGWGLPQARLHKPAQSRAGLTEPSAALPKPSHLSCPSVHRLHIKVTSMYAIHRSVGGLRRLQPLTSGGLLVPPEHARLPHEIPTVVFSDVLKGFLDVLPKQGYDMQIQSPLTLNICFMHGFAFWSDTREASS